MQKHDSDEYSDAVATKRMEDALRRALNTPHKSHADEKHPRTDEPKRNRRKSPKSKTGATRAR